METIAVLVVCFLQGFQAENGVYLSSFGKGVTRRPISNDTTTKDFWSMYLPPDSLRGVSDILYNDRATEIMVNTTQTKFVISDFDAKFESNTTAQFLERFSTTLERDIITEHLRHCPLVPLCTFSLNITHSRETSCCQPCACNDRCYENNTCCPDKLITNQMISNSQEDVSNCLPLNLKSKLKPSPFTGNFISQISLCPKGYKNETMMHMCESKPAFMNAGLISYVPILDKQSGLVYHNIYCAKCNNINSSNYIIFETQLGCKRSLFFPESEQDLIKSIHASSECDIKFFIDSVKLNACSPVISECNVTGEVKQINETYETACKTYTSIVTGVDGIRYRNVFCALCNDANVPQICEGVTHENHGNDDTAFSVSAVINVTLEEPKQRSACQPNYIYSDQMNECIRIRCPIWHVVKNSRCVQLFKTTRDLNYRVIYLLKPYSDVTLKDAYIMTNRVTTALYEYMNFKLSRLQTTYTVSSARVLLKSFLLYTTAVQSTEILSSSIKRMYVQFQIRVHGDHHLQFIEKLMSIKDDIFIANVTYKTTLFSGNDEDFNVAASMTKVRHVKRYDYRSKPNFQMTSRVFKSGNDGLLTVLYLGSMKFPDISSNHRDYVRITPFSLCPLVQIDTRRYPWVLSSSGVIFPHTNQSISVSHVYFEKSGRIFICLDKFVSLFSGKKAYKAKVGQNKTLDELISLVCITTSLVCTLITILTFICIPKICSLYVKAIVSLSINLIIAQGLHLINTVLNPLDKSIECEIIGVLSHFFILLYVFWVQVIGFYFVLVEFHSFPRYKHKRFLLCNIYCILLSTACVISNFSFEFSSDILRNSGYGGLYCSIRSRNMLIYTLCVPVAFVVFTNVCCFVMITFCPTRLKRTCKDGFTAKYEMVKLLMVSLLIGSTWTCGYFYMWSTLDNLFKYFFLVLYSGHGVCIMISYVCRVSLFEHIKSKFSDSDLMSIQSNVPDN